MSGLLLWLASAVLMPVAASAAASAPVEVVGLFNGRAVLRIPGIGEKLLKVGQEQGGVKLLAADATSARVRYRDETHLLTLSSRIAGTYRAAAKAQISINADSLGQYQVRGSINGQFVNFLVDTGASIVAISSRAADGMGIEYLEGRRGTVQTAQGVTESYFVNLDRVTVGGISVPNVQAAVIRGNYPVDILLGMSFLKVVKMEEDNGVLLLTK
ncbi:MAG: TIGR02281 family clan AA aspartic protease [Pseudomonadales bacterium]